MSGLRVNQELSQNEGVDYPYETLGFTFPGIEAQSFSSIHCDSTYHQ